MHARKPLALGLKLLGHQLAARGAPGFANLLGLSKGLQSWKRLGVNRARVGRRVGRRIVILLLLVLLVLLLLVQQHQELFFQLLVLLINLLLVQIHQSYQ